MKKLVVLTTLFVLMLVFVVPLVLTFGIRYLPFNIQPSLDNTVIFFEDRGVVQEFVSEGDYLTGVGMTIKNPNLTNKKDVELKLYEGDTLLQTAVVSGDTIEGGTFVKFIFSPIADSGGKTYRMELYSPKSTREEFLEVYMTEQKPEWMGEGRYDDKKIDSGVSMVQFNRPTSRMALVKQIYSEWTGRIVNDVPFAVVYGVVVAGLVALLVI